VSTGRNRGGHDERKSEAMNTMLNRTRSSLALGVAMVVVATGALAGAPTASACPIDTDGTCLAQKYTLSIPTPTAKQKHVKQHKAVLRHSR
jgi:hypothetical protein